MRLLSVLLITLILASQSGESTHEKRQILFPGEETPSTGSESSSECKSQSGAPAGQCRPFVQCSVHYAELVKGNPQTCTLEGNTKGICCQDVPVVGAAAPGSPAHGGAAGKPFAAPTSPPLLGLRVDAEDLNDIGVQSVQAVNNINTLEDKLQQDNIQVSPDTPEFGHLRFFQTTPEAKEIARQAIQQLEATQTLQNRFNLGPGEAPSLNSINVGSVSNLAATCPQPPRCRPSKYRTMDGSCNNVHNPLWGKSQTAMQRILHAEYSDGISAPRVASDGQALPSARLVSVLIARDSDRPDPAFTLNVMQFGQFMDHDLTMAPIFQFDNAGIQCCLNGFTSPRNITHRFCFPIEIPQDDPFYSRFRQRCMNFVRSMWAPRTDCTLGYVEQMDQLTQYIDGSMIYGSTERQARSLKDRVGGRLLFQVQQNRMLPPFDRSGGLVAGDTRINEQPGLTTLHVIWLREHNRIADELSALNPQWDHETIYQETRRIVIAEIQHIIYNEWLPIVLGRSFMSVYGLLPLEKGYFEEYDPTINAGINNEFAAAGFRLGHTMISGIFRLLNERYEEDEDILLQNSYNRAPFLRRPDLVTKLVRGMSTQASQRFDPFISESVTNQLFRGRGGFGLDLMALNIQRGRDHGIPGYNKYRELCGMGKAASFDDLRSTTPEDAIASLSRLYRHVDDIDLFAGMITEMPHNGAMVGPTTVCIVGDQFARLRRGDRYFYDVGEQRHSFSPAQLQEIRKASMARVFCDNSESLPELQPLVFRLPNEFYNPIVPCDGTAIPRVDLFPWKGERV